jgi:hypothetical protein
MYIHIGNRKIISDRKIIGIFNVKTIIESKYNLWIKKMIGSSNKTIIIGKNSDILTSNISSCTIISRNIDRDLIWRRSNE